MPQLDQFAFLGHAFFIYLNISVMTLFLMRWIMPKLFSVFRVRTRLVHDQHPGIPRLNALTVWARKRQWIGLKCNWRTVRYFAKFSRKQFWNLQSFLRVLYHPYWKNLTSGSITNQDLLSKSYAAKIRFLNSRIQNGPELGRRSYQNAVGTVGQTNTSINIFKQVFWRDYFRSSIKMKLYNYHSYDFLYNYHNKLYFLNRLYFLNKQTLRRTLGRYQIQLLASSAIRDRFHSQTRQTS